MGKHKKNHNKSKWEHLNHLYPVKTGKKTVEIFPVAKEEYDIEDIKKQYIRVMEQPRIQTVIKKLWNPCDPNIFIRNYNIVENTIKSYLNIENHGWNDTRDPKIVDLHKRIWEYHVENSIYRKENFHDGIVYPQHSILQELQHEKIKNIKLLKQYLDEITNLRYEINLLKLLLDENFIPDDV